MSQAATNEKKIHKIRLYMFIYLLRGRTVTSACAHRIRIHLVKLFIQVIRFIPSNYNKLRY